METDSPTLEELGQVARSFISKWSIVVIRRINTPGEYFFTCVH